MTMIGIIIAFLILTAIAVILYFRRIIIIMCCEAGINSGKRIVKITVLFLSVLLGVAACNFFSFCAVFLFHIVILSLFTDSVNFLIGKKRKKRYAWRKIYAYRIIPILMTVVVMTYGYVNINNIKVTSYTVLTGKNIREEGYRIALIADVHYGVSAKGSKLRKICNEIGQKDVDAVILCGDIVDDNTSGEGMKEVFSILSSIKTKSGIYYVYGNHDRQSYSNEKAYSETDLRKEIEKNNIIILKDRSININGDLIIIGREDASFGRYMNGRERKNLPDISPEKKPECFMIVADHQPKDLISNASYGADLIVSGHTHGGQIWPINIIDELFKINEINYGIKTVSGETKAIVTSGLAGWNYPIKTAAPAEYVIIDIKKKD